MPTEPQAPLRVYYWLSDYISHYRAGLDYRTLLAPMCELVDSVADADVVILHDEPTLYPRYFEDEPLLREKVVVACITWEASELPPEFITGLKQCDLVWTCSEYCRKAIQKAHPRVRVVPYVVAPRQASQAVRTAMVERLGLDERNPHFLTIVAHPVARKNTRFLVDVFSEFHARHPDAHLLMKVVPPIDDETRTSLSENGILYIDGNYNEEELAALHEISIAHVSLHHSEGWGLALSDAMAHGRPVVAPAYSGNVDFMTEESSYFVDTTEGPIDEADRTGLFREGMSWGHPSRADALEKLEAVLRDHESGLLSQKGEAAKKAMMRLRPEGVAKVLGEALTEVMGLDRLKDLVRERRAKEAARVSRDPKAPRLGLLYRMPTDGGAKVGLTQAVDDFVLALDRHAKTPCEVFVSPRDRRAIEAHLRPKARVAVRVSDALTLQDPTRAETIFAWHELAFDADRPFAIRRRLGRRYPITLTHHSLSYRDLLHTTVLRLLLEGPEPFDSVVCSSAVAREVLEKLLSAVAVHFNEAHGTKLGYKGRLDVIPLGVDTHEYRPRDRASARARFSIPSDAFVLLWVGRFSAIDKADLVPLISVFERLVKRNPSRRLHLVCAGSERPFEGTQAALEEHARALSVLGQITFLRGLTSGLASVYAAADVFVSPVDNVQESFGLAPVEAMASGLPVVVSDFDGYRDTVVEGETGFRIPTLWASCDDDLAWLSPFTDDPFDHLATSQSIVVDLALFEERLQALIDNDDLRKSMGERARQRAVTEYSLECLVARHEALWAELASIAQKDRNKPFGPAALDHLPFVYAFDHYPSCMLDPEERLELTNEGRSVATGARKVPLVFATPGVHDEAILSLCLTTLMGAEKAKIPASAGDLVTAILRRTPQASMSLVVRQILWLMKQGLLQASR